jgi:hypothetical protein
LDRKASWFEPWVAPDGPIGSAAPLPRLTSIACDELGRIWVSVLVPDANWRNSLRPSKGENGEPRWTVGDGNRYFDTVIELIDPARGAVLASQRFDRTFPAFFSPGFLWSVSEAPSGEHIFEIWRVRMTDHPLTRPDHASNNRGYWRIQRGPSGDHRGWKLKHE